MPPPADATKAPSLGPSRSMIRSSGWLWSQTGRWDRIGGIFKKLCCGGGEVVAHSRLDASQGLSPAGMGFHHDTKALTRKIDTEKKSSTEPALEIRFRVVNPSVAAYSAMRLGIPFKPTRYIGRKVTFVPTNISQNVALPRPSRSIRPVIFGYQ